MLFSCVSFVIYYNLSAVWRTANATAVLLQPLLLQWPWRSGSTSVSSAWIFHYCAFYKMVNIGGGKWKYISGNLFAANDVATLLIIIINDLLACCLAQNVMWKVGAN